MARIRPYRHGKDDIGTIRGYHFWCPACDGYHGFQTNAEDPSTSPSWTFNGDLESPTFAPSLRCSINGKTTCHLHLEEGMLKFCSDSPHALAGKTVPLPEDPHA